MLSRPGAGVRGDAPFGGADAGLRFSEVMAGRFALNVADPDAATGATAARLILRATLTIDSMERFLLDPSHTGSLVGAVTFAPIGAELRAATGSFNLFAPSGDPALKLMIYRATFESSGAVYTLHGEKHVRRGSMLRGWPDTTTLRCRLHAGADSSGAVRGAGILRISVAGFTRQLLSFRPVNGAGFGSRARAATRFLIFFSQELLDSYL